LRAKKSEKKNIPEKQKFGDCGERLELGVLRGRDAYLGGDELELGAADETGKGKHEAGGRTRQRGFGLRLPPPPFPSLGCLFFSFILGVKVRRIRVLKGSL
jgi:hypothetical protein